ALLELVRGGLGLAGLHLHGDRGLAEIRMDEGDRVRARGDAHADLGRAAERLAVEHHLGHGDRVDVERARARRSAAAARRVAGAGARAGAGAGARARTRTGAGDRPAHGAALGGVALAGLEQLDLDLLLGLTVVEVELLDEVVEPLLRRDDLPV